MLLSKRAGIEQMILNFQHIRKSMFGMLGRSWILYLGFGFIMLTFVDHDYLMSERLNYLQDQERYLERFSSGQAPYQGKKLLQAVKYYREVIRYLGYKSLAYGNLAFCYFHLHNFPEVIKNYKKAIELDGRWYSFYYDLGVLCLAQGDFKNAASFLENGLSLILVNQKFFQQLAENAFLNGDKVLTGEFLGLAEQAQKDEIKTLVHLGVVYYQIKDYLRMKMMTQRALKKFPDSAELYFNSGLAHYALKEYRQALDDLNKAITIKDDSVPYYYYRGLCLRELGEESYKNDFLRVLERTRGGQEALSIFPDIAPLHFYKEGRFFKLYGMTGLRKEESVHKN